MIPEVGLKISRRAQHAKTTKGKSGAITADVKHTVAPSLESWRGEETSSQHPFFPMHVL